MHHASLIHYVIFIAVLLFCMLGVPGIILGFAGQRRRRHRSGFVAAENIAEGTREFASLIPDAAVPVRFLLVKRGSDAAHFALAGAGDRAIGVCEDQTSASGAALPGLPLRVARLGVPMRSKKVAINSTVAQDDLLVPGANGYAITLPTTTGTYWVIGAADQAGAASGVSGTPTVIEFLSVLPYKVVNP